MRNRIHPRDRKRWIFIRLSLEDRGVPRHRELYPQSSSLQWRSALFRMAIMTRPRLAPVSPPSTGPRRAPARAGRTGAIVNFSSQGWWTGGFGGSVVYNATKGGIVTLTRGLARSYAAARIRVNSVAPGLVDTPMLKEGLATSMLQALVDQVPLGRMATPAEVAPAVVFLASDHAVYITGATLNISGGFLMY